MRSDHFRVSSKASSVIVTIVLPLRTRAPRYAVVYRYDESRHTSLYHGTALTNESSTPYSSGEIA